MKTIILAFTLLLSHFVFAQFNFGGSLGTTGYAGDLNHDPMKRIKPSMSAFVVYEANKRLQLKTSLLFGKIEGNDKYGKNREVSRRRNLSFQSGLTELSTVAEVNLLKLNKDKQWTPYAFAGVSVFRFDPYITDSGKKVYLKPLSTEGQGLSGYGTKPYSLFQFAIPFGGGIKYRINESISVGAEASLRLLFTDYLDDVSSAYIDKDVLYHAKGSQSVRFAYRGDGEYPAEGAARGRKSRDWWYFTGFHFMYHLETYHSSKTKKEKKPVATQHI